MGQLSGLDRRLSRCLCQGGWDLGVLVRLVFAVPWSYPSPRRSGPRSIASSPKTQRNRSWPLKLETGILYAAKCSLLLRPGMVFNVECHDLSWSHSCPTLQPPLPLAVFASHRKVPQALVHLSHRCVWATVHCVGRPLGASMNLAK